MMIHVNNEECCGCTACSAICNHKAISMVPDALGFLYPKVDMNRCTNCGLCQQICSFNDKYDKQMNIAEPIAFAVRHKDINEVETSRSGAAFIALSDKILEMGGVVYGAGFSKQFEVIHKRATTKEERNEFKGSKYTQSLLGDTFFKVKNDLQNGLKVMFSGTACQTAGLNAYVGKKYRANLFLVDIICHGVASPFVWQDYLNYLEKKERDKIISVDFRNKKIFGWSGVHKESFTFKKKGLKTYNYTFYNPYMIRHSCNECVFANTCRPSDITLGDFWGWEKAVPGSNTDDKGISLVLCNTQKGKELFDSIRPDIQTKQVQLKDCLQPNLQHPTLKDPKREEFENDYKQYGFKFIMKKYGDVGIMFHIKRVKRFMKRILKF